jgi:hypothetical protein
MRSHRLFSPRLAWKYNPPDLSLLCNYWDSFSNKLEAFPRPRVASSQNSFSIKGDQGEAVCWEIGLWMELGYLSWSVLLHIHRVCGKKRRGWVSVG